MFYNRFTHRLRRRTSNPSLPVTPITNGYRKEGGGTISNPQTWGQWFENQPTPVFKPGHSLPDLGQYLYGFAEPSVRLALFGFGYAVEIGGVMSDYAADVYIADAQLATPTTSGGKVLKAGLDNPGKYRYQFQVLQRTPGGRPGEAPYTLTGKSAFCKDANGVTFNTFSPIQDEIDRQYNADNKASSLIKIVNFLGNRATVSVVSDGGENGIGVTADWANTLARDPAVVADAGITSTNNNDTTWVDYISRKKAYQEIPVANALRAANPNRQIQVYYPCTINPYRGKVPGWNLYDFEYDHMEPVSDRPSGSIYYKELGFNTGLAQMLTLHLASAGALSTTRGSSLTYDFVSGGWFGDASIPRPDPFAPIDLFEGWLKCCKTAGQIGAILGYFSSDAHHLHTGSDNPYPAFNPNNIPHLFQQFITLGEVHARFSWLEEFLFSGDLVPGANRHAWYPGIKAHEIPCRVQAGAFAQVDPNVRCVVRKLRSVNKWLLTVWCQDGTDRQVIINEIPGIEQIELTARRRGSIYIVDKTTSNTIITQQDANY